MKKMDLSQSNYLRKTKQDLETRWNQGELTNSQFEKASIAINNYRLEVNVSGSTSPNLDEFKQTLAERIETALNEPDFQSIIDEVHQCLVTLKDAADISVEDYDAAHQAMQDYLETHELALTTNASLKEALDKFVPIASSAHGKRR